MAGDVLGGLDRQLRSALWRDAVGELVIRHPDDRRTVMVDVIDGNPPQMAFHVANTPCTVTGKVWDDFMVSTVRLRCWPGKQLAQVWIAAAWASYLQHEALELVTYADLAVRPLDPHDASGQYDRALRMGLPVDLTMESLEASLAVVMPRSKAREICHHLVIA